MNSIRIYIRYDLKTPTVNVGWNDGRNRNKSFGPARFTEAWVEAYGFYTSLLNEKIISDVNQKVKEATGIDYDLFTLPETP